MQAGEKLSFIKPFEGERHLEIEEQEVLSKTFLSFLGELIGRYPHAIKSVERLGETGFVTVFEGSYRVMSSDGSYVHVLAFGRHSSDRLIEAGISIIEHTDTGIYEGGYVYLVDDNGLTRDTCFPSVGTDREDRIHFSLMDSYDGIEILETVVAELDGDATNEEAIAFKARLDEKALLSQVEKEMGYNRQSPEESEIIQLQKLIQYVEPFTPPETDDDDNVYL